MFINDSGSLVLVLVLVAVTVGVSVGLLVLLVSLPGVTVGCNEVQ